VSWFSKREQVIESEQTDSDRLAIATESYQESKTAFNEASAAVESYKRTHKVPAEVFFRDNKAYAPINRHQRGDPVFDELTHAKEKARQVFCQRLNELAEAKKRAGLVK